MTTGMLISISLIFITLVLSNMFGETRATRMVAKELRLIRELLEKTNLNPKLTMKIIKDDCPICKKETEQVQKETEYGCECICRECKTRFGSTNPKANKLT